MKKLSLLVERSVREARITRLRLADEFERSLRSSFGAAPVTCLKGCDHCCYHPLSISVLEGIEIYRYMVKNHLWGHDRQQAFREHAEKTWGQTVGVWLFSQIPCPLLKDHRCALYKKRPLVCRITVSRGDPTDCHPHRFSENTRIVPRKPWLDRLEQADKGLLRQHKLSVIYLPLSSAVLYGEKVCKGELELADLEAHLMIDFMKGMQS
jgi:hypothetical protein